MKDFKELENPELVSGAIKFSTDYASKQQIFEEVSKWADTQPKLLSCVIRGGGDDQIAMDFKYDTSSMQGEHKESVLLRQIKDYFIQALSPKSVKGWDYASNAIVIK